jgi:hypothetical protein
MCAGKDAQADVAGFLQRNLNLRFSLSFGPVPVASLLFVCALEANQVYPVKLAEPAESATGGEGCLVLAGC